MGSGVWYCTIWKKRWVGSVRCEQRIEVIVKLQETIGGLVGEGP